MANQTPQTFALKVKMSYTDRNIQELKARFLRFDGVDEVDVEAENELVIISGTVDPQMVIDYLEGKKIKAEFCRNNDRDSDQSSRSSKTKRKGGVEKKSRKAKEEEEEEEHVCEAYVAPTINPLMCRDPYCKNHKSRPTFHSKVPSIHSGDHPRHNGSHSHLGFGHTTPSPIMHLPPYGLSPSPNYGYPSPNYGYPSHNYGYPPSMPGFHNFRGPFF